MKRFNRHVTLFALLPLGLACSKHDASAEDAAAAVVSAEVVTVAEHPFVSVITALGTVQARAGHIAALSAAVPARVSDVRVSVGQHVDKGAMLVEFESAGFVAAAHSADAALDVARRAAERQQRLVGEGIAARRELEQAQAEVARAVTDSVNARRVLELAGLRSPIAGVVTRLNVSLGSSVDPNQVVVEVADPASLDVVLTLTPADAARVHRGDVVTLTTPGGGGADSLGTALVADVGGAVDSASRGVPVRAELRHSSRELRIGESLSGTIVVATHPHAITIPASALVPEGDGFRVFVVDSAQVAHATPVEVGGRRDSTVEILSGLHAGDRVVTAGAFGVDDSAHIAKPGAHD